MDTKMPFRHEMFFVVKMLLPQKNTISIQKMLFPHKNVLSTQYFQIEMKCSIQNVFLGKNGIYTQKCCFATKVLNPPDTFDITCVFAHKCFFDTNKAFFDTKITFSVQNVFLAQKCNKDRKMPINTQNFLANQK